MAKAKQAQPTTGTNPLVAVITERPSTSLKDSVPVAPQKKDAPIHTAVIRTHNKASQTSTQKSDSGSLSKSAQDWVLGKITTKQHKENLKAAMKARR